MAGDQSGAGCCQNVRERPHGQVAGVSMARYTGPVCRICRRHGLKLFLKGERCFGPKCAIERRNYPPGDHGQRRRKLSEYANQLKEKQKSRYIYGVLERQFRKHYATADRGRSEEHTSELQSRLHLVCRLLLEKKK